MRCVTGKRAGCVLRLKGDEEQDSRQSHRAKEEAMRCQKKGRRRVKAEQAASDGAATPIVGAVAEATATATRTNTG